MGKELKELRLSFIITSFILLIGIFLSFFMSNLIIDKKINERLENTPVKYCTEHTLRQEIKLCDVNDEDCIKDFYSFYDENEDIVCVGNIGTFYLDIPVRPLFMKESFYDCFVERTSEKCEIK